jgi:hypothetical protein
MFNWVKVNFAGRSDCSTIRLGLFLNCSYFKKVSDRSFFKSSFSRRSSITSSVVASRWVSPLKRFFPPSSLPLLHLYYRLGLIPSRWHMVAILSSPFNPSSTILIFSSDVNLRRVFRLISRNTASRPFFLFSVVLNSNQGLVKHKNVSLNF